MEFTAPYRKKTFSNSQAAFYSFSERCETCHITFYPSTTHQNIFHANMACVNQSDMSQIIQMNDSSFVTVQRFPERDLCELKFTSIAWFCNDSRLFLIFSLITDAIYDFLLGWWIQFFFHSLIKSSLLAGKDCE